MPDTGNPIDRAAFLKRAGGLFAVALIDRATLGRIGGSVDRELHHPDPRPGINADHVLTTEDLGDLGKKKSVGAAYDAAREYPEIFDGLSCACGCAEHGAEHHRSLLACYETKQPTGCGGCREEATFVAGLAKEKKTLAEIRIAVDKKFG